MRKIRLFPDGNIEEDINTWVESASVRIVDIIHTRKLEWLVIYEPLTDEPETLGDFNVAERGPEPEMKKPRQLAPVKMKKNAVSPIWEAMMRTPDGVRAAPVMAGVFPVPEGFKMHPEDREVAPPVLLAKGADLAPYSDLFGNIEGHKHEQRSEFSSSSSSSPAGGPAASDAATG